MMHPSTGITRRALLPALAALGFMMTMVGCGSPAAVPVNYAPSSIMTAAGALTVSDFKYLPAEAPTDGKRPVDANQIRNTAMGDIKIDRDVKQFVRDAVFAELRLVGIKVNGPNRVLTGVIEEFLVDDLGYSVDWTLRVKYMVVDPSTNKEVYSSVKNLQRRTAKFANFFGMLNEAIKLNVEELVKDPEFIKTIN